MPSARCRIVVPPSRVNRAPGPPRALRWQQTFSESDGVGGHPGVDAVRAGGWRGFAAKSAAGTLTVALLVSTSAPARADGSRAELAALAERERLVPPSPPAAEGVVPRVAVELRGGGFVAPGRGSGGGVAIRAGARFGAFALDAQAALSLLGGGVGPLAPSYDAEGARHFKPSYASGVGFFVPSSVIFSVIPIEALELGAGPSFDLVSTTSPSSTAPYFGIDGRVGLRFDVRPTAERASRRWLLTLGLTPHVTFADVPLLSFHGALGAAWE